MNFLEQSKKYLACIDIASLRFRTKSENVVNQARTFAEIYKQMARSERISVQSEISEKVAGKLLSLSARMAENAIDTHDGGWILAAIVMHLIEDFRVDYRENIRYLVLINYAAKAIGINFLEVVETLRPLGESRGLSYLDDFLKRNDDLNSLSSFGIKETKINNKTCFIPE